MKNSKNIIIIAVIFFLVMICGAAKIRKTQYEEGINTVTRYQWIEMLGEEFGINEYSVDKAYFKDVGIDNFYFTYVQAAVEWGIIDNGRKFDGEKPANGRFIALTTMKAIGKYKVQIYLGINREPDEEEYLEVAIINELIKEEQLKEEFTKDDCVKVLKRAQELNDLILWKDDVEEVVYKNNVTALEKEDIVIYEEIVDVIELKDSVRQNLSVGNIIIFEINNTGLKTARKIKKIGEDGKIELEKPIMEEVFETLTISDMISFNANEIAEYFNINENNIGVFENSSMVLDSSKCGIIPMDTKEYEITKEGISFYMYSEKQKLYVGIENKDKGHSTEYLVKTDLDENTKIKCSFEITNIDVGTQFIWSKNSGVEYANVVMYTELAQNVNMNVLDCETEFSLFEIPIPIANGLASINMQFKIVISAEGEISIKAKVPIGADILYENGKVRNNKVEYVYPEPEIKLTKDIKVGTNPEWGLEILKLYEVASVETEAEVIVKSEKVDRDFMVCTDRIIAYPIVTIKFTIKPIPKKEIINKWELVTEENARHKYSEHYEQYEYDVEKLVDECTYGKEKEKSEFSKYYKYELPIGLKVNGPLKDSEEYYTIRGNLILYYGIKYEEFDKIKEGERFNILDKQFVKGESFRKDGYEEEITSVYSVDDGTEFYICTTVSKSFGLEIGRPYYYLYDNVTDYNESVYLMEELHEEKEVLELKIAKEGLISSNNISYEDVYTVKECFEENIYLNNIYSIATYSLTDRELGDDEFMYFDIIFDENGVVNNMTLMSYGIQFDYIEG